MLVKCTKVFPDMFVPQLIQSAQAYFLADCLQVWDLSVTHVSDMAHKSRLSVFFRYILKRAKIHPTWVVIVNRHRPKSKIHEMCHEGGNVAVGKRGLMFGYGHFLIFLFHQFFPSSKEFSPK